MKQKGKITYIPPSVLMELKNVMDEENIRKPSTAFNRMAEFSNAGRALRRLNRMFGFR